MTVVVTRSLNTLVGFLSPANLQILTSDARLHNTSWYVHLHEFLHCSGILSLSYSQCGWAAVALETAVLFEHVKSFPTFTHTSPPRHHRPESQIARFLQFNRYLDKIDVQDKCSSKCHVSLTQYARCFSVKLTFSSKQETRCHHRQ